MALKIISFIFIISLAFGIAAPTQIKAPPSRTQVRRDVPFDVNEVINRVSPRYSQLPNHRYLITDLTGEFQIDTTRSYAPAQSYQWLPSSAFDGANFFVAWEDNRNGNYDIYSAWVDRLGVVIDSLAISTKPGDQLSPALAHGDRNQVLITYSGWTDSINHQPINTMRIWCKFYPGPGIEEEQSPSFDTKRFMLEICPNPAKSFLAIRLPHSVDRQNLKIFDVSGKLIKVVDRVIRLRRTQEHKQEIKISLKGINPGIYFLKFEPGAKIIKKLIVMR